MSQDKPEQNQEPTFEEAYTRLEQVVAALENSQLPLEEAVKLFQEGAELYKLCSARLEKLELVVKQLSEQLRTETGTSPDEEDEEA